MASLKPLIFYGSAHGPNPWKVVIILHELNLPFTTNYIRHDEVKQEPYTSLNPNGRVPALKDPNTGIVIWESGAIIEYLVENYDVEHKISHSESQKKWHERQFLHFQMSGQGPYFGQYMWFARFHPEDIASAKERYLKEIKRVIGVLDKVLDGKSYLVGNKCTYADLAFIPWNLLGNPAVESDGFGLQQNVPHYTAWMERLMARPAVKKMLEERSSVQAEGRE